ncbi:DUF4365 domain-containing protein [Nonomuraea bangladeshensis]
MQAYDSSSVGTERTMPIESSPRRLSHNARMRRGSSAKIASVGVARVRLVIEEELGWIFREQSIEDYGIDAHVEIVDEDEVSGRLLAFQIKSGMSWFRDEVASGWWFYPDRNNVDYWLRHSLPVVVIVYHPILRQCFWQNVNDETLTKTSRDGWKLLIPKRRTLNVDSILPLKAVAGSVSLHRQFGGLSGGVIKEELLASSDITVNGFVDSLSSRLLAHEAVSSGPISLDDFVEAFKRASRFSGREVKERSERIAGSTMAIVEDKRCILKMAVARDLKMNTVNIVRFIDAPWAVDILSGDYLVHRTIEELKILLAQFDRYFILRRFSLPDSCSQYQLVEVPKSLLNMLASKSLGESVQGRGCSTIRAFRDNRGEVALKMVIDRSSAKISLRDISIDRCLVHGSWTLKFSR